MPAFRPKGQLVTAEELRSLGELITQRFALDLEIRNLRNVHPRYRHLMEEKMKRAGAALGKIRRVVQSFDGQEYFTSPVTRSVRKSRLEVSREEKEIGCRIIDFFSSSKSVARVLRVANETPNEHS